MAATISIITNATLTNQGLSDYVKQGNATDAITTGYAPSASDWTLNGQIYNNGGTLATATVVTAWQSAQDYPTGFQYGIFWSDQNCYIQAITAGTNNVQKVLKQLPFVFPGFGSIIAAANTTAITGGAEPSVAAITKIVLGNYSGTTMNWRLLLIN